MYNEFLGDRGFFREGQFQQEHRCAEPTENSCTLPIELTLFKGRKKDAYNLIEWRTATEENVARFEIQRRKRKNGSWETIGEKEAQGSSSSESRYLYKDRGYERGTNYYRLLRYDLNGDRESFPPILIRNREHSMEPVRIVNPMGQEVSRDHKGLKILVYPDGSTEKLLSEKRAER
jgi:hypothetical protein